MEGVSSHKSNLELVTNNCKAMCKNYEISLTKKILDVLIDKVTTFFFSTYFRFCQTSYFLQFLGILLPKLFGPTVRENCSSDREFFLKFKAEGREFAKFLRSLEQFIQTVKGQNNFW